MQSANPTQSAQRCIVVLLAPVCVCAAKACWNGLDMSVPPPGRGQADQLRSAIDPDTAPWWELTVLPRIGEVTAKRIVAYRDAAATHTTGTGRRRLFACPADLERVYGIGPKTAQRIAPYLTFEPADYARDP